MTTRTEAAEYLGVSPGTLANWASTKRQRIPYVKAGKRVTYRRRDLDRWLDTRVVDADALNV